MKLAERAYMLETGRVSASGPASELASDPLVVKAYLGSASLTSTARALET